MTNYMKHYMTTTEASTKWGISSRRINTLCAEDRIPGAYKEKKGWMIPVDARKPVDMRYKSKTPPAITARRVAETSSYGSKKKLSLPIGLSDYKRASTEYYYVDKTLMIRDFLDEGAQVSLFTRPRRFGKTLNMDMMRVFFEKTEEDTSIYFRDKKIWECGHDYLRHQGKYPVIFLTFKDVKCRSWADSYELLYTTIRNEFARHVELQTSARLSAIDKEYLSDVLSGSVTESELMLALVTLSRMLHAHHDKAPIIIIDEYDIPIQQGHVYGFYDEAVTFIRNFFSGGFKDNPHLSYALLTGILRVVKESIFSGLNNITVYSVLDDKFSEYFGFTHEEIKQLMVYYEKTEKYQEICDWYDGYRFGESDIFNPWSVINYFQSQYKADIYWVSTSSNDIIHEILKTATARTRKDLEGLMRGKSIVTEVDTSVIYPQIQRNPASIYSFLLVTGYLKAATNEMPFGGVHVCEITIPNKEIAYVYKKEILSQLKEEIAPTAAFSIQSALYKSDAEELKEYLGEFLIRTISYYDTADESFYHGLMLGLCAMMDNHYHITSNRESGEGRYDIQLMPKRKELPGILIELKAQKQTTEESLTRLSQEVLCQINENKYETNMRTEGIQSIYKYGVAFSGKHVEVSSET